MAERTIVLNLQPYTDALMISAVDMQTHQVIAQGGIPWELLDIQRKAATGPKPQTGVGQPA